MKLSNFLLSAVLVVPVLTGCAGRSGGEAAGNEPADGVRFETAREWVENDVFIDFDDAEISLALMDSTANKEDLAQAKAAVYRFYKHVTLSEDSLLQCTLKNGAEINVSDRVFKAFMENINEMNERIKSSRAEGVTVLMAEPTEEYLRSLLE